MPALPRKAREGQQAVPVVGPGAVRGGTQARVAGVPTRLVLSEAALLGGLVGDLKEVGDRHGGEHGRAEARSARSEQEPGMKAARGPEAEAVRADQELADRPPQAAPAGPLLELRGTALALELGERSADEGGHLLLRDQPAERVAGRSDQGDVAGLHAIRQVAS